MKLNTSKIKTINVSGLLAMHPQSSPLTIGRTVPKESNDLVISGVTFDSKMTFEKHLHSISRAASQKVLVSRKSPGECSMIDRFLGDAFVALSCPVWGTVLQCGAQLSMHTLNNWTMQSVEPGFKLGVYLNVTLHIAHSRSVAVLYMLYKTNAPF